MGTDSDVNAGREDGHEKVPSTRLQIAHGLIVRVLLRVLDVAVIAATALVVFAFLQFPLDPFNEWDEDFILLLLALFLYVCTLGVGLVARFAQRKRLRPLLATGLVILAAFLLVVAEPFFEPYHGTLAFDYQREGASGSTIDITAYLVRPEGDVAVFSVAEEHLMLSFEDVDGDSRKELVFKEHRGPRDAVVAVIPGNATRGPRFKLLCGEIHVERREMFDPGHVSRCDSPGE